MGLFQKKPDPIAEREKLLKEQLAAVEAEIKKLNRQQAEPPAAVYSAIPSLAGSPAHPRLRSTALPHKPANPAAAATEPIFEEIAQNPFNGFPQVPGQAPEELGTRKTDMSALLDRIKNHFRGPSTSNPKLVNYLAAGSIQGLRPLRYEKRVARNRFIVLAVFLLILLWGLIAIFFNK